MQKVKYARAGSVDEAVALLEKTGAVARVLAGGTDVIVQARERRREIELFVDIKGIAETQEISFSAQDGLTIGAALPCYRIYGNETVSRLYPALAEAAKRDRRHRDPGQGEPRREPLLTPHRPRTRSRQ